MSNSKRLYIWGLRRETRKGHLAKWGHEAGKIDQPGGKGLRRLLSYEHWRATDNLNEEILDL